MSKSIMSNKKECYICKRTQNLHRHHIFGGANRKWSEQFGAWVYLCAEHHNMSDMGVHMNREVDLILKRTCQELWEAEYGTREDFRSFFGKSYL